MIVQIGKNTNTASQDALYGNYDSYAYEANVELCHADAIKIKLNGLVNFYSQACVNYYMAKAYIQLDGYTLLIYGAFSSARI